LVDAFQKASATTSAITTGIMKIVATTVRSSVAQHGIINNPKSKFNSSYHAFSFLRESSTREKLK